MAGTGRPRGPWGRDLGRQVDAGKWGRPFSFSGLFWFTYKKNHGVRGSESSVPQSYYPKRAVIGGLRPKQGSGTRDQPVNVRPGLYPDGVLCSEWATRHIFRRALRGHGFQARNHVLARKLFLGADKRDWAPSSKLDTENSDHASVRSGLTLI